MIKRDQQGGRGVSSFTVHKKNINSMDDIFPDREEAPTLNSQSSSQTSSLDSLLTAASLSTPSTASVTLSTPSNTPSKTVGNIFPVVQTVGNILSNVQSLSAAQVSEAASKQLQARLQNMDAVLLPLGEINGNSVSSVATTCNTATSPTTAVSAANNTTTESSGLKFYPLRDKRISAAISQKSIKKEPKENESKTPRREKQSNHPCEICGKCFKSTYKLGIHLQSHSDLRPYVCEICGQSFKVKGYLTTHIKSKHSVAKAFKCDKCSAEFGWKAALYTHTKTLHSEGKDKFICEYCGKEFLWKSSFKTHIKRHEDLENMRRMHAQLRGEQLDSDQETSHQVTISVQQELEVEQSHEDIMRNQPMIVVVSNTEKSE